MVHRYLYVVVDVFDPDSFREPKPERGQFLFWIWRGYYYTMNVLDLRTRKVKPILNIVLIKKLSDREVECLDKKKPLSECLDGDEILSIARKRLENARKKYFTHLTDQDIEAILERMKKALGMR